MTFKEHPTEPLPLKVNMLWNSAGSLVYFGFQWLLTIAVVRISGDYGDAGVLALAMAAYNIVNPIAVYRMYTYQVSDVSHENSLGEYLTFRFITAFAALLIGVAYAFLVNSPNLVLPIALFMLGKMVTLHIDTLHATMQLNGRMDYIGKSDGMQGCFSFIAFCIAFWVTGSLNIAFIAMIVVIACVGVVYDLPRAVCFEPIKLGISGEKVRHLLGYCFPIVVATIACSAVPSISRQYLAMVDGEALLGIYASVSAPAVVIQMGASYIYNPLLSTFAQHFANRDASAFAGLLARAFIAIGALGCVSCLLFAWAGEWVLVLFFGESIVAYAYLLLPVVGCTFATAMLWFMNDVLISVRRFGGMVAANVAAFAVSLAVTPPLVGMFDANGVSFAVLVAFGVGIVVLVCSVALVLRQLKAGGAGA